jgi:hypothetical protein
VKGVANRRREGDRFRRTLEALSYGSAEWFRFGSEQEEEQINRKNEWGLREKHKRKEGSRM